MYLILMLSYIGIVIGLMLLLRMYLDLERSMLSTYTVAASYSMLLYIIHGDFSFRVSFKLWWIFSAIVISSMLVDSELPFPRIYCSFKTFIAVAVVGPVSEEVFFRGVLLSIDDNVFLNAVVFSLLHFDPKSWLSPIYAFAFGLTAGGSVLLSESLFPPIFFHILNNSLEFILKCRGVKIHWRWLRRS